jgi:hypothetical protein
VELLPTELVLRRSCGCPPGAAARSPIEPLTAHSPDAWIGAARDPLPARPAALS